MFVQGKMSKITIRTVILLTRQSITSSSTESQMALRLVRFLIDKTVKKKKIK